MSLNHQRIGGIDYPDCKSCLLLWGAETDTDQYQDEF